MGDFPTGEKKILPLALCIAGSSAGVLWFVRWFVRDVKNRRSLPATSHPLSTV